MRNLGRIFSSPSQVGGLMTVLLMLPAGPKGNRSIDGRGPRDWFSRPHSDENETAIETIT